MNHYTQTGLIFFKPIKITGFLLIALFLLGFAGMAQAAGTASGTNINNAATLDYQVGGVNQAQIPSNTTTFVVDNRVDLTVANIADATVIPGSTDQVIAYSITNTGNTTQGYSVSFSDGSDDFDMNNVRIYLDVNGDGNFDGGDTLYLLGTRIADVAADNLIQVLIVSDTPLTATDNQTAAYNLIVTTLNAGTTTITAADAGVDDPNTVQVVFGDGVGTDDAAQDGIHSALATYTVSSAALTVTKSFIVVSDPFNGAVNPKAIPGATIRYTILINNTGSSDATAVTVVDATPTDTTYVAASITLDTVPLTDVNGDDAGDYGATNANAVTVIIPTLASTNSATITFDVVID